MDDSAFWDQYYGSHLAVGFPSPFAEFCIDTFLDDALHVLELGSGNGRDSFYFYDRSHTVTAVDQSMAAIELCQRHATEVRHPERMSFVRADFTRLDPGEFPDVDVVYSRFTLHSIDATAERRVIDFAWEVLPPGGRFLVEARTTKDPLFGKGTEVGRNEFMTDHYRRHINAQELLRTLLERGFEVQFFQEDNGLATFQGEDPVVVRVSVLRP